MPRYPVEESLLREPNLWVPGKKPVGPVKIDSTSSMARDISAYFVPLPINGAVDIVNGNMPSVIAGAGWESCSEGLGWRTSADGHYIQYPYIPAYGLPTDFTLFWRGYIYGEVAGFMGFMSSRAGAIGDGEWNLYSLGDASNDELQFQIRDNSASETYLPFNVWPAVHPELYSIVVTMDTATAICTSYIQYGRNKVTGTETGAGVPFPFTSFGADLILNEMSNAFTSGIDAILLSAGIWNRKLSEHEAWALNNDPYQFLIPA